MFVDANDTGTDPNNADSDNDGLIDGIETNTGTFVGVNDTGTDPNNSDTDGDTVIDGQEVLDGSDPLTADSIIESVPVAAIWTLVLGFVLACLTMARYNKFVRRRIWV